MNCPYCDEPVLAHEEAREMRTVDGPSPFHIECFVRLTIGSAEHIRGTCRCFLGELGQQEPDLPPRECARRAYAALHAPEFQIRTPRMRLSAN